MIPPEHPERPDSAGRPDGTGRPDRPAGSGKRLSHRERRVLDAVEEALRGTDPDLCERLSRFEPPPGPFRRAVGRLAGTRAILGWSVALVAALLLGLPGPAVALFVVLVLALSVRVSRIEAHLPDGAVPPPPFGLPPYWPR